MAVVWAGFVFYLSTGGFGSGLSEWLLRQALASLHLSLPPATFALVHFLLRKAAHTTEYAMLSVFLYGSQASQNPFDWRGRRAFGCVAVAALYSLTDEFHQSFVPGRTASLADCAIDTFGASLGMLLIYIRQLWHQAKSRTTAAASTPRGSAE